MPPSQRPPEKTHYSYKEMMDRLKRERRGGGGGGASARSGEGSSSSSSQPVRVEVVEGPDGEQRVAEVRRRRRRRSHQPKKIKEARIRRIKRTLFWGGIPLVGLIVASYFLMLSRIKSEGFRLAASARLSELAGADLEFGKFKMRGLVLSSRKVAIDGVPGTLIRGGEAAAPKATASAGSLLSGDWKLGMVQASNSQFRFGPEMGQLSGSAMGLPHAARPLAAGLGLDRKPDAVYVEGLRFGLSDFIWEDENPDIIPFVEGTSFSVGRPGSDPLSIILTGGKLAIPSWPEFEIGRISGRANDGVFEIQQSTLEHGKDGVAKMAGRIGYRGPGGYNVSVAYENIEARELVHPYWGESIAGLLDGNVNVSGSLTDLSQIVAEGEFTSTKFVVSGNRMLIALAHEIGEALLQRIEFRNFTGSYRRDAEKTEFYNLAGEHRGLFKMRGGKATIYAGDGRLYGEFEIGIPKTILDKVAGGRPEMFGEPDNVEFCWTKVLVDGLVDEPRDDLTPQLQKRRRSVEAQERRTLPPVLRPEGGTAPQKAGDSFEQLIQP